MHPACVGPFLSSVLVVDYRQGNASATLHREDSHLARRVKGLVAHARLLKVICLVEDGAHAGRRTHCGVVIRILPDRRLHNCSTSDCMQWY